MFFGGARRNGREEWLCPLLRQGYAGQGLIGDDEIPFSRAVWAHRHAPLRSAWHAGMALCVRLGRRRDREGRWVRGRDKGLRVLRGVSLIFGWYGAGR